MSHRTGKKGEFIEKTERLFCWPGSFLHPCSNSVAPCSVVATIRGAVQVCDTFHLMFGAVGELTGLLSLMELHNLYIN